jgi:hypothetical protein
MGRSAFKLKSGNNAPFKMMGSSSPMKDHEKDANGKVINHISREDYRASNDTTEAYMHQVAIDDTRSEPIHSGLDLAVYSHMEKKYGKEKTNKTFKTGSKNRVTASKASSDKLDGHKVSADEYFRSHNRARTSRIE